MSNISSIIDVYRMSEISPTTRVKIMTQLGASINYEFASNLTQDLIAELVKTLPVNREDLPETAKFLGDKWKGYQGF